MTTAGPELEALHAALLGEDAETAARLLPRVTVGVLASRGEDGRLSAVLVRDRADATCLLLFLTHDAWLRFGADDEPVLLLAGAELGAVIDGLQPDLVVVNPAGPDPVQLGADVVAGLAAGEVREGAGRVRVFGDLEARPDPELTRQLHAETVGLADTVVGLQVLRGARSHPTVAVRAGGQIGPADVLAQLQGAQDRLPADLELLELAPEVFAAVRAGVEESGS